MLDLVLDPQDAHLSKTAEILAAKAGRRRVPPPRRVELKLPESRLAGYISILAAITSKRGRRREIFFFPSKACARIR